MAPNITVQSPLYALLLVIPLLLLLLLSKQAEKKKRSSVDATNKLPPGPNQLPIIGNLHQLGASQPHHSLHRLSNKHGPLMFLRLGSINTLVISSADAAREVFKAHDLAFSGRPCLYAARKLSYGYRGMAFAPYGEYWRQVRKVCFTELLSAKRVCSARPTREAEVALLVDSIAKAATTTTSSSSTPKANINFSEMVMAMVNRIVCGIALGVRYGPGGLDEKRMLHGLLAESQSLLGGFCISDFFPWMSWVHTFTGLKSRLEKNFKELDEFYGQVINDHIKSRSSKPTTGEEDLVDVMLRLREDPTHRSTFGNIDHVKAILTDMFIAGTDTSSATLVWAMTELLRNPRVMEKAQEEVRRVVGNRGKVEECDLPSLDYLKLVIKETMRLHATTPLLVPRETTEACRVREYVIPAKTRVYINAAAIGMDPKRWENPHVFRPERFSDNPVDFWGLDFEFIPFGTGRRICPGISFAVAVMELALANLLYCFDWGLPSGMKVEDLDMEEAVGITVHKKSPLWVVAIPVM